MPARTPTTRSATSSAWRRKGPDSMATERLPAISSPTGSPRLADSSACRSSGTVTPTPLMRTGSICTITARPGPPIVLTSRVPATRLRSASILCATRSRSNAPVDAFSLNSVKLTIGTSSMPLGLMIGSSTPSPVGSQSAFEFTVSYSRTSASVRVTPTLNWTVSTARPGRDTDITCSTSRIWLSTCSAGTATICSTSRTAAPGKGISTLAIVTSICGSSSRGVTPTANRPSSSASSASSGVIRARWKKAAMRPETPMPEVPVVVDRVFVMTGLNACARRIADRSRPAHRASVRTGSRRGHRWPARGGPGAVRACPADSVHTGR